MTLAPHAAPRAALPLTPSAPLRARAAQLANLILAPKNIPELHEGADAAPKALPVPKAALGAFKFKLKAPKGFGLIWSNKGGTSREKLSIWAADVEHDGRAINWKKSSRCRVSVGYFAVPVPALCGLGARPLVPPSALLPTIALRWPCDRPAPDLVS